jgi:hypothetical protein
MSKVTYFLFGEQAVDAYEDGGADLVLELYEENDLSYQLFMFDEGHTSPGSLLYEYSGHTNYIIITEEEYNKLI